MSLADVARSNFYCHYHRLFLWGLPSSTTLGTTHKGTRVIVNDLVRLRESENDSDDDEIFEMKNPSEIEGWSFDIFFIRQKLSRVHLLSLNSLQCFCFAVGLTSNYCDLVVDFSHSCSSPQSVASQSQSSASALSLARFVGPAWIYLVDYLRHG